ncbi:hypothetical protein T439DRAFT_134935 [Meredithblackwellia eburnea MCA 4105]
MSSSTAPPFPFARDSLLLQTSTLLPLSLIILAVAGFLYSRSAGPKAVSVPKDAPPSVPDPTPYKDFDLKTARTRDHIYVNKQTLRHPYFQTMAHQPMKIDDWIEIDKDYMRDINMKKAVIEEHGERVLNSLSENDDASAELLETLIDYLPKRYPTLFEKLSGGIWNKITDEKYPDANKLSGVAALKVVSRLVQDDFLMGRERPDGHVYFTGGVVAHPGFYDFGAKIGKSLEEVHRPVPQFNEKMLMSVERTLKRFQAHQPFERSSWEMVDDYNLYRHNIADLPDDAKLAEDLHPKDYIFRIDHQTFRKLPRSQGIIFGVHPILRRLEDFTDSPMVPALLATIHEQSQADLMKYKLAHMYQDKMLPYLRELTKSQIERGLITGTEAVEDFRDLVKP